MNISMIGTGSWGTALALVLHENGHNVKCWTNMQEQVQKIKDTGENGDFLPGIKFPKEILVTTDMNDLGSDQHIVVSAVPSQVTRLVAGKVKEVVNPDAVWVTVAKGIENKTYLRISQVIHELTGIPFEKIVALSGPSHA